MRLQAPSEKDRTMPTDYLLYFKTLLPNILRLEKYVRGSTYPDRHKERAMLLEQFIAECNTGEKPCMQVGVRGSKLGKNWVSVDLFDRSPEIDYHYDVQALEFGDECFEGIICNAVLEHVENPHKAINELFRVLKKGGRIWVEVPFNQPYHPTPGDFWRVTPDGLRLWMRRFKELSSGGFFIKSSLIYTGAFFFGERPF
jgi:SAM-dependent methyltransferase